MKRIIVLCSILVILLAGLIFFVVSNNNQKMEFVKPEFDTNVINIGKDNDDYKERLVKVREGYSFFIEGNPIYKDNELNINFYSSTSDDIYLKVRILDKKKIIGESGLLKTGDLLKTIGINSKNLVGKTLTYIIMGYEKDSYLSAGEVKLSLKVGDYNEE